MTAYPQPTTAPQYNPYLTSGGFSSYIPMSSAVNPAAANYQAPMSSSSNQVNAYGAPLYSSNIWGTNNQIVPTNPSTGQFLTQPSQPAPAPAPTPSGPSPDERLISSIFDPTMNYLNQAQSQIQQQQPGVEQDILNQYATSRTSLEGEKASGERSLVQSEEKAGRTKTDAASAARRLYQELVGGGRQRFGGASSAGPAYGELTANQLQRGLGTVQQQFGETMQKIDGYRQDLQQKAMTAFQELENQKNTAINEAQRYFQDKLLEISRLKAETESNKSMARLQELQNLRNQVYAINLQAYQTQQQWAMTQKNAEELLNKYQQQALQNVTGGQGVAQAYNPPITNRLSFAGQQGSQVQNPMGRIGKNPREETG